MAGTAAHQVGSSLSWTWQDKGILFLSTGDIPSLAPSFSVENLILLLYFQGVFASTLVWRWAVWRFKEKTAG